MENWEKQTLQELKGKYWTKQINVSEFESFADYVNAMRENIKTAKVPEDADLTQAFDLAFYALGLASEIGVINATRVMERYWLASQSVHKGDQIL
ncbi:hypothetical protein A1D22_09395 [Pasteurellaceae bacterium LFhippo2]|nr:hypothetical protein [Pasteurellaceae bacterium LFhippo2]